jgi:hypothetical protein
MVLVGEAELTHDIPQAAEITAPEDGDEVDRCQRPLHPAPQPLSTPTH